MEVGVKLAYKFVKKAVSKESPSQVFIELTHRCNLQCEHCFLKGFSSDELKTEDFVGVLQKVRNWGVLFIGFTGGEIFCREDILYLLEKAKTMGFFFHLQTNGTLISSKVAKEIKKLNPTKVEISLYGARETTHDSITQVAGSFEKSLKALKALNNLGVRTVIKTSLMRKNIKEMRELKLLAEKLKSKISFDPLIAPRVNGKVPPGCRLNEREIMEYLSSLSWKEEALKRSAESQLICGAGRSRFTISPDGTIYPCVLWRIPLGNIKNTDLDSLWESKAWREIREIKVDDLKVCPECELLWECARCPGFAYLETGDFLGPSPENCRLAGKVREVRLVGEKALH